MLANRKPEKFQVAAVTTPGWGKEEQAWALEDLTVLTGGCPFFKEAGHTFNRIKLEDLGQARRAWADQHNFGIVGGRGNPRRLRQHIAALRRAFGASDEPVLRGKLLQRIGKLLGGSATLWVGGPTELELEARKESAERTAAAMRGAMIEGILPGGGVALLACRPTLQRRLAESCDSDERAAYHILIRTMEAPLRAIVTNAGYDASEAMSEIKLAGPGHGFDVTSGQVVDVTQAGICDAAVVLKSAVYAALSSAALALTLDVLVHRAHQPGEQPVGRTPSKKKQL